jgi:hypothetical protein
LYEADPHCGQRAASVACWFSKFTIAWSARICCRFFPMMGVAHPTALACRTGFRSAMSAGTYLSVPQRVQVRLYSYMPGSVDPFGGAVTEAAIKVEDIRGFQRELKALGSKWPRELTRVHQQIGRRGAALSRAAAGGMGGVQAKAASTIKGRGTQKEARVSVSGMRGLGNVAFWGAKKHTGWYAAGQYGNSATPQHPRWVGNSWDVAVPGEGPYAINPALALYLPELLDQYMKMIDDLARKAFPSP